VVTPAAGKLLYFSHDEYGLSHGAESLDDAAANRIDCDESLRRAAQDAVQH
jgi:hypothetical protein